MSESLRPTAPGERRRVERRSNHSLLELTLPEFRRIVLTSVFSVLVLLLFFWMVRTVVIAAILAIIVAVYIRPLYRWLRARVKSETLAALLSILIVLVPFIAGVIYSYVELSGTAEYVAKHDQEIVQRIDAAVRRLPFFSGRSFTEQIRGAVLAASNYGARLVGGLKSAVVSFSVSASIFLFTTFYVLTEADTISAYVRSKLPPRYGELVTSLERNVRGVLYGAIYATLVTQTAKTLIVLFMNLAFGVPLAVVLAILSFVIGFFPIVGSWSVYLPVAIWLAIFREAYVSAVLMVVIGFFGNTIFISTYLRPKIAAAKSRVLNFYWMFIGLVTGVYTFGLVGILLGPIIIGMLKAVLDTITSQASWRLLDADGDVAGDGAATGPQAAPAAGALIVPDAR